MTRIVAATLFVLASLTVPAMAADVGHDCAEGEDDYVAAPQQTPIPLPAPGS